MHKVGIYAGAFDPIHMGHVAFAKQAIKEAGLDKVYLLVEPHPRHKQGVKAMEHRVAMVELAIANEPALGLIDLQQARFTIHETWPRLQARFKGAELTMLMGEDVFMRLSHWPRIETIATEVKFVVGLRQHDEAAFRAHLQTISKTKHLTLEYQLFTSDHPGYASRKIRASLRAGETPTCLHPDVLAYIQTKRLYADVSGFNS